MLNRFNPMPPGVFARKALDQVARNKGIILIPAWYRGAWLLYRLFPSAGVSMLKKRFQNAADKLGIH